MADYLLLDFGGTFVKYALSDKAGEFKEQGKIKTILNSKEEFFTSLEEIFSKYRGRISGCAVSMPGKIDTKRGVSVTAGAFTRILENCSVGEIISKALGVPVTVGNDAKCAAAAEAWSGALKNVENGFCIVFGTGIGGGIVINHKVHMGSHFSAGELSEYVYDGVSLANGQVNSVRDISIFRSNAFYQSSAFWYRHASTTALLCDYRIVKGISYEEGITGEEFFWRVRDGEEEANIVLKRFADCCAACILSIQSIVDGEKVAIGGGISGAPELLPALQKAVDELWKRQSATLPVTKPEIVPCAYGNDANLLGALKLFLERN